MVEKICGKGEFWAWNTIKLRPSHVLNVVRHSRSNPQTLRWMDATDSHCCIEHFAINSQCCCQDLFIGLETKTETLAIRSRDQDRDLELQVLRPRPRPGSSGLETETETWTKWTRVHSSLETMASRSQHCKLCFWGSVFANWVAIFHSYMWWCWIYDY